MKLQVLELPSVVIGEVVETPFALVLSEVPSNANYTTDNLNTVAELIGARATIIFDEEVEVVR